jgi:hypothetical protein
MSAISPPVGAVSAARRAGSLRRLMLVIAIYLGVVAAVVVTISWAAVTPSLPPGPPPFPGQQISGSIEATIHTGGHTGGIPAVAETLLGGAIAAVQKIVPPWRLMRVGLVLLAAALALAVLPRRVREPWRSLPTLLLLSALSILCSLRLSVGMDEFYINLKHSWNLRHFGVFSANAFESIEATVDFLPFAAATVLSAVFPISLASAAIAIGLFGNVLLIFTAHDIARRLTGSHAAALATAALIAVLPPVLFVGATGFMATLFGGLLLLAFDWIVVRRGRWAFRGFVLLGLLPLVRLEGILPGCVMLAAAAFKLVLGGLRPWSPWRHLYRSGRIVLLRACVVLVPLLLLSLWRYLTFGTVTPTPVTFKNIGLQTEYLRAGIAQLFHVLHYHRVDVVAFFFGPAVIFLLLQLGVRALAFVAAMVVLCLAYYTGGGDWFADTWARYPLPMICLLVVLVVPATYRVSALVSRWPLAGLAAGLVLIGAIVTQWPGKSVYQDGWEDFRRLYDRWARINSLSALGSFLKHTTPERARIGTAEMATINYFAERDLVDLLGIANPDIARSPLNPGFGAGDMLHKKRDPDTLLRRKADVLALYEMAFWLPEGFDKTDAAAIGRFAQEKHFNELMMTVAFYRVGDLAAVERAGFRMHLVIEGNYLYVYWIGKDIAAEHARRLAASSFRPIGDVRLDYRVMPRIAERFPVTGSSAR